MSVPSNVERRLNLPTSPLRVGSRRRSALVGKLIMLGIMAGSAGLLFAYREQIAGAILPSRADASAAFQTFRVIPGDLTIMVTEDGNVESSRNIDLRCQVEGGSQILWIIKEGSEVQAGDELVRLNSSLIEEKINAQKIVYERAYSTYIQAEEAFAVAAIAVKEYEEGKFHQELQLADANVVIARQNLKSAENSLSFSERMFRKGYLNKLQLEADQFAVDRSKLELDAAMTARKVLVEYTKQRTLKELESTRDSAKAKMEAEQAAAQLEKLLLERLNVQRSHCVIKAPSAGMVVYANDRNRRRSETPEIEEGSTVREHQSIIWLPDLTQMQAKVAVHESKIERIRPGMPATVKVLESTSTGSVINVGNQPEPGSWYSSSVREYATIVRIDDAANIPGLKPGMTAEVEILIDHLKNVLYIPLLGVVEEPGGIFCYVAAPGTPSGYEKRPVVIGPANDKFIVIQDGLKPNDEVILNPRATVKEAREQAARQSEIKARQSDQSEKNERNQSESERSSESKGSSKQEDKVDRPLTSDGAKTKPASEAVPVNGERPAVSPTASDARSAGESSPTTPAAAPSAQAPSTKPAG